MKPPTYPETKASGFKGLGHLPNHWEVVRGRFVMQVNPPAPRLRILQPDDEVSFVPMEALGEYGGLNLEQTRVIADASSGYTEFQNGDVVVAKITPCFENGKAALARDLVNGAAYGTTELLVLRAGSALEAGFLFYIVISDIFRKLGESEMYGAGGQKRVPPEFTKDFPMPVPPLPEQRQIATFLDWKTGQIDALIARKKELLNKLKEKRTAIITQAVTKGLNPGAPTRDSGIPWLGQVPEHWKVGGFTKYVEHRADYRGKTPEKVRDGIFLVTAKNIKFGKIDYEASQEYVREDEYDTIMSRGLPRLGDLLFTTEAPLGEVANVDREDIALAQRVIKFRGEPKKLNNYFAKYWMMSAPFQGHLSSLATGSTAKGIKASKLFALRCVVPPLDEQGTIVAYLNSKLEDFAGMEEKIEGAINILTEFRNALITAATTGKIDLRNVGYGPTQ
jgi:type I restriction enzyme S subunit